MRCSSVALAFATLLTCASSPTAAQNIVTVFFATNRFIPATSGPPIASGVHPEKQENFGGTSESSAVSYGMSTVNIPARFLETADLGEGDSTPISKVSATLSGIPMKLSPKEQFLLQLKAWLTKSKTNKVLLFVHGFNNSHKDAALRFARLSASIGYPGASVMFTWGSKAEMSGYWSDEATAGWSVLDLLDLVSSLRNALPGVQIDLIAHSMGGRVAMGAIEGLSTAPTTATPPLGHVVFASPDVDLEKFKEAVPSLAARAKDITVYTSKHDKAIRASRIVHNSIQLGGSVTGIPGVDIIDASGVAGSLFSMNHSFFVDHPTSRADLRQLLVEDRPAQARNLKQTLGSDRAPVYLMR